MNFLRIATLSTAITSCLVFVNYVKEVVFAYVHDFEFSLTFILGSVIHILFYLSLTIFFIALFLYQKDNARSDNLGSIRSKKIPGSTTPRKGRSRALAESAPISSRTSI